MSMDYWHRGGRTHLPVPGPFLAVVYPFLSLPPSVVFVIIEYANKVEVLEKSCQALGHTRQCVFLLDVQGVHRRKQALHRPSLSAWSRANLNLSIQTAQFFPSLLNKCACSDPERVVFLIQLSAAMNSSFASSSLHEERVASQSWTRRRRTWPKVLFCTYSVTNVKTFSFFRKSFSTWV